jgi:CBS domain-containing protein
MVISDIIGSRSGDVAVIGPDALVAEAADMMDERKIGIVVVCSEDGVVLGLISERDIVRAVAEGGNDFSVLRVDQLFTEEPQVCSPSDNIEEITDTMHVNQFRHMPVVEYGKLVGMVSLSDILAHTLEEKGFDEKANIWSCLEIL